MNDKTILFWVATNLFSSGALAQEIIHTKQLGKFSRAAIEHFDEVNALVFKPEGYDTVMNPRLPDSLSLSMRSREEREEIKEKRIRFNPYLVFHVHLVKFDLGLVSLRYYYPLDQREKALSEINNTWGIIRFQPDKEFTHPNHEGWRPPAKEPDLYFGKFSFLNDPEQVKRERKEYQQRKLKGKANGIARDAAGLARSKNIDMAKLKFAEALEIDPRNKMAYRYLLLISLDENNEKASRRYQRKLLEIDPKDEEAWFLKGLMEKRYQELDSATTTFERIVREKDPLHFRSYVELAYIAMQRGDEEAADRHFRQAINIFKTEGQKSLRRETHRILNINDLFKVRLAYAKFLNANSKFVQSKELFEQTLKEEALAVEAGKMGERQAIYGKLSPANLGELNFMLAISYSGIGDEPNTRLYLQKAKDLGRVLPAELERFLKD